MTMACAKKLGLAAAAMLGVVDLLQPSAAQRRRGSRQARRADPAAPELVFLRPFRHLRSGAVAARLQDLQGSLLELPSTAPSVPHARPAGGPGFTEEQVKALAATYTVQDGPNDAGEMFERPGRPSDHFPSPFPNPEAAAAALGAAPPDMSLLAKARKYERGFPLFVFDALPFVAVSGAGAGLYLRAS